MVRHTAAPARHRTQSQHRYRDNCHRFRLITYSKVGQSCMACDGHVAGVVTLHNSVFVVCGRREHRRASLERYTDNLSGPNLLDQLDKRIHQEALRLAQAFVEVCGSTRRGTKTGLVRLQPNGNSDPRLVIFPVALRRLRRGQN